MARHQNGTVNTQQGSQRIIPGRQESVLFPAKWQRFPGSTKGATAKASSVILRNIFDEILPSLKKEKPVRAHEVNIKQGLLSGNRKFRSGK